MCPIAALLVAVSLCAAAPQEATQAPSGIQVTSARIVRTPAPGLPGPRVVVETETEFLTTDPAAFYMLTYTGVHKDDKIRLEWRNPTGAVVQQNDHTQLNEVTPMHLVWRFLIAGAPAASAPGGWQAHLFWNDRSVAVTSFKISAPPATVVRIATRTALPSATLTVPYFLQLSAQGGNPPYRWTAVKTFPAGLSLSETGAISGTPQRRGTFRAVVEARDSAGNSVSRTLGIGVGPLAAAGVQSHTRNLLKSSGRDACSQSASQTEFSASDPDVVLAAALEAPRGREGRVEWLNPRGEIFQVDHVSTAVESRGCVVKTLPLAGRKAAQEPGNWRVRLFWADAEVFTLNFTVTPGKAGTGRAAAIPATPARSGRLAIVIDNLRYDKLPPQNSPLTALDALANALHQDRFDVILVSDASLDNLRQIERTLDEKLQAGDTALVYYAGFDARTAGDDWLLPVNFDPADSRPMQSRAYSAVRLLQWLEDSKAALKFVFLDSAPPPGQPNENPGAVLAEVDESTALVYSRNPLPGAFTRALAEVLGEPDVDARTVLGVDLPKLASRTGSSGSAPVAILGGGADFVFRQTAR